MAFLKPIIFILMTLILKAYCVFPCTKESSIDISKGDHRPNGDILFEGKTYTIRDYFFDKLTGSERGCVCLKTTCARKCCNFSYGYDKKLKECVELREDLRKFDPPVWNDYVFLRNINASQNFHFIFGKQSCINATRIRISQISDNYHLRMDGKLYISLPNSIPPWTIRSPDRYCLDTFVYEDEKGEQTTKLDALVCFAEDKEEPHYVLSSTCMLISCVFILATVAVYAWLPELRNKLHGRVLTAYLLCLMVGFAFLATMQLMLTVDNITINTCLSLTFFIYYFILAAFFWLNVMCFDIWWTFSGKRGLSLEKLSIRGRFNAYALYAFGFPTALTILLITLEFSGIPPHPLLPMIKHQGCFLFGKSKLLYLYGPITTLCIANLVFFVLTAVRIAVIDKQTSVLKSKDSATNDEHQRNKQRLHVYVKLFLVMGINWILEVISAIYPDATDVWKYTDAYNVLIGLIIFIIFVCKRKVFRLMKKRYKQIRGDPMSRTQTTSTRTMSSRDDVRLGSVKSQYK